MIIGSFYAFLLPSLSPVCVSVLSLDHFYLFDCGSSEVIAHIILTLIWCIDLASDICSTFRRTVLLSI